MISGALVVGRGTYSYMKGETDPQNAAKKAIYDYTGLVAGGKAGAASMGLTFGMILGPYGAVVGGLFGAVAGGLTTKELLNRAKNKIHTKNERRAVREKVKTFLQNAYDPHALKAKDIFEEKAEKLLRNLDNQGEEAKQFRAYIQERIQLEREYLENKLEFLKTVKDDLDKLGDEASEIAREAFQLVHQVKVHPAPLMDEIKQLKEALEQYDEKLKKLNA